MNRVKAALALLVSPLAAAASEEFSVNPDAGNSGFAAVFDDALGEMNVAVSSSVGCDLAYDRTRGSVSGHCAVPLGTVRVDNNAIKSKHFREWVTNNQSDPTSCKFEAVFKDVKVEPLVPDEIVPFSAEVLITVCGRGREDGGKEKLTGTARLFPPNIYRERRTIRIRAVISTFHRDLYHIDPKYTEGWRAKLESLADAVAEKGAIEFCLFAEATDSSSGAVAVTRRNESESGRAQLIERDEAPALRSRASR